MIVLALDPGLANTGWAVMVALDGGRASVTKAGVFRTKPVPPKERKARGLTKIADKSRRVRELATFLDELIRVFKVEAIAHEGQSLGMHQSMTLFDMGLAFGVLLGLASTHGLATCPVSPADAKERATHNRKAGKTAMVEWARAAFPSVDWPRATMTWEHLADALAVGLEGGARLLERVAVIHAITCDCGARLG